MKTAILCLLLMVTLIHAASIQPSEDPALQPLTTPPARRKRFILDWFDDDDYFDDFPLRRRRPSRRLVQLAQMIKQLAGPGGLTPAQMGNIQQNLQTLQLLSNVQNQIQLQNLQAQPSTLQPMAGTPQPMPGTLQPIACTLQPMAGTPQPMAGTLQLMAGAG